MTEANPPKDVQIPLMEVRLLEGSPLLAVGGRPTAWFENWLRADPAAVRRLYEGRWTIDESPGGYR